MDRRLPGLVRALEESIADSLIQAKERGFDTIELKRENGKVTAKMHRSQHHIIPNPRSGSGGAVAPAVGSAATIF